MYMRLNHRPPGVAVAVLTALVVLAALVSVGAAGSSVKKQRIAIEEKCMKGACTWTLTPLTPGSLKADSGRILNVDTGDIRVSMRDGQSVTTYPRALQFLAGKLGTLQIPNAWIRSSAGGGFDVGEVTWSIRGGSDAYAGLHGGGRGSVVWTKTATVHARLEGYVG